MSRFNENSSTNRIICPHTSCEAELPESEWSFQEVTDHICPNGHTFRVEGTTIDTVLFYRVDFELTEPEYFI